MKITILVTYSKPEFKDLVIDNLNNLDRGGYECELLIMDDSKSPQPWDVDAEVIVPKGNKLTSRSIPSIRSRIAEVRNYSKGYVGKTDFVFSFEDDTIVDRNALTKLLAEYTKLTTAKLVADELDVYSPVRVGLVSGIQVGRHSRKILGAWHVDNYQFPSQATSLGVKDIVTPLAEVDGTGMYCYLTPTHLYKAATYGWQEPFGPDVWYGLYLRSAGYVNYVDQSLICPHKTQNGTLVPDENTMKIKLSKNERGQWINNPVKG